jgi:hypothetical protein
MPESGRSSGETECDGCGTTDCDNWRWSVWHAVTLCRPCAEYWKENNGELPDKEQAEVTDFAA